MRFGHRTYLNPHPPTLDHLKAKSKGTSPSPTLSTSGGRKRETNFISLKHF